MTLHTLLIIILWFFAIVLFAGTMLVVFLIGRGTVKNNPKKAYIFIKNGLNVEPPIKGSLSGKPTKKGHKYIYNGGFVMVPSKYKQVFYKNRRMLFIDKLGQLIALPFDNDTVLDNIQSEELILELIGSHIGSDAIRALRGKQTTSIIIVALIAFALGAIIVFGATQYMKTRTPVKQTTTTQQQNKPVPIEVK